MPPLSRQNASLLLLNNLLSVNPGTSPFTLVQDTVEQSARPLIRHVIQNALVSASSSSLSPNYRLFESTCPGVGLKSHVTGRRLVDRWGLCFPARKTFSQCSPRIIRVHAQVFG